MGRGCGQGRTAILRAALLVCLVLGALLGGQSAVAIAASRPVAVSAQSVQPPHARPLGRLALSEPAGAAAQAAMPASPGNFPFHTARSADGLILIHYYNQPASFAQTFITLAQQDLTQTVQVTLGFPLRQPVNIYVYATRADFLAGAPVTNPAETGALTDFQTNTVYLQSGSPGDDGATDALPHELTHVVFHQNEDVGHLADSEFGFLPLWLDEGLAAYDEPQTSLPVSEYEAALANAVTNRHPVDVLHDFTLDYPANPDTDELAYAESRAFIAYLIQVYGLPTFHHFLGDVRDGQFLLGAQTSFGADLPMLESRWEVSLGLPPTVKDAGLAPVLSTPFPFPPGKMFPLASQTTPVTIPGPVDLLPPWQVALLLALLLVTLVLARRQSRPRRPRRPRDQSGVLLALPAGEWQAQPATTALATSGATLECSAPPPPDASAGTALPAPVPANLPYPMPLEMLHAQVRTQVETSPKASMPAPMDVTPLLEPAELTRLTPRAHVRWFDAMLLLAAPPLAAAAGFSAIGLDPRAEWHTGYLAAALTGAACAVALGFRLLILRRGRRMPPAAHIAGMLLALLVAICSISQATPAALTQAREYESRDAYTLALRTYADSGEPARQLAADEARVHDDWARAALLLEDYSTVVTQYDAAILDARPFSAATHDRAALLAAMARWGEGLRATGKFDAAVSAYANQLASSACDTTCAGQMRSGIATTYLAWAAALSIAGNYAGALSRLSAVTTANAGTEGYAQARSAAREVAALQAFEAALAAGAHGNSGAMNTQLHALLAAYPNTAAAQMAGEAAQPVSGTLADASGASTAGDRLYFLAFTSQGQARTFQFDFNHDTSVFKVATTVGGGGAFTVRLPAGYWYVPCWDDPTWASNNYFNASQSSDNSAFFVQPLAPANVGGIVGF